MKPNYSTDINTYQEETQPPEWEALLNDVTYPPNFAEIAWDPQLLGEMFDRLGMETLLDGPVDVYRDEECVRQIELTRKIADRKLQGLTRQVILLLLGTGASYQRMSELLHVSVDTIQRQVKQGVQQIRNVLKEKKMGEFPAGHGKRPTIRASLFPLDTKEERIQFVTFLNQHTVVHVAYNVDERFREVLAVYMTEGGRKKRLGRRAS